MHKVLVADDSIAVRKVAERLLTEAGLGVALAANGEEALAYLSQEVPDLIVSDVIMPDKSGYEVCAFVRAQSSLAATPVLLISGIVNDEVIKQAESCRADGVLKKPFQGTSLKDRVLELLVQRHSQPPAESAPHSPARSEQTNQQPGTTGLLQLAEANLRKEREQTNRLMQKLAQLETELARLKKMGNIAANSSGEQLQQDQKAANELRQLQDRVNSLEETLKTEREQSAILAKRAEDELQLVKGRVGDLEGQLRAEQEQSAEYKRQAAGMQELIARVEELESALRREREDSARQSERLVEMQRTAERVKELEASLTAERQAAAQLVQQVTEMERAVVRSQELAQECAREKQRSDDLARRLTAAEDQTGKVQELEGILQTERERNAILARRMSESEQTAEQATKRFEALAKKLGEIAGLASQLGRETRRS